MPWFDFLCGVAAGAGFGGAIAAALAYDIGISKGRREAFAQRDAEQTEVLRFPARPNPPIKLRNANSRALPSRREA